MATWTDQRVRPSPRAVVPPPSPRPQPARSQPRTVLGLIALGALAVVALWWLDTPSVSGFGDWLTNAGRITGLLAGYAVVIPVSYTHLRAHETKANLVCRLLL